MDIHGRTGSFREQDLLKTFDVAASADNPFLTVSEITDTLASQFDIEVSENAVRARLREMTDEGDIARRQFGPHVAYRAVVGPKLAAGATVRSDARQLTQRDNFVKL